jgi:hypothetical protein
MSNPLHQHAGQACNSAGGLTMPKIKLNIKISDGLCCDAALAELLATENGRWLAPKTD